MANGFEEAKSQGYSRAEMAADMEERQERVKCLGCMDCVYITRNSRTCLAVIESELAKCPYKKGTGS